MPDNIEIDLLAELKQATEQKPEANGQLLDQPSNEAPKGPESENTDQKPEENKFDQDFEPGPSIPTPGEAVTSLTYSPEKTADLIIEGIDALFEHGLPSLYEASLSKEDRHSLKALALKYRQTKNQDTLTLNEKDQRIMEVFCDFEDYKKMCPMDDDEKKSLKAPLIEVLKKQNYQTSPENALMISASIIALPRLLPVIKNKAS